MVNVPFVAVLFPPKSKTTTNLFAVPSTVSVLQIAAKAAVKDALLYVTLSKSTEANAVLDATPNLVNAFTEQLVPPVVST